MLTNFVRNHLRLFVSATLQSLLISKPSMKKVRSWKRIWTKMVPSDSIPSKIHRHNIQSSHTAFQSTIHSKMQKISYENVCIHSDRLSFIRKQSESWSEVKICCSKTNPCFRKCCPEGETWDPYVEACNSTSSTTNTHWRFENHQKFPNAIGLPQCPQEKFLLPFSTASKNFYPFSPLRVK